MSANDYPQGGEFRPGADYPHQRVFYSDGDGNTEAWDKPGVQPNHEWRPDEGPTRQPIQDWEGAVNSRRIDAQSVQQPVERSALETLPWRILKAGVGWFLIVVLGIIALAFVAGAVSGFMSL